ncbi:MAG: RNA-binding protein [Desulfobacteraceae bacterium]|nr:MAG: RNA-binding protein [Desulfobacteraceae bacterium]
MEAEELVGRAARALAAYPETVTTREIRGKRISVVKLTVAREDYLNFIGHEQRNAVVLRDVTATVAKKLNKVLVLEILEQKQA